MAWARLFAVVQTAIWGLFGAWRILSAPEAPRWCVAASGLLLLAGLAASAVILALLWVAVTGFIRPRIVFRRPDSKMALARRHASLVGLVSFTHHPIRFWGALTLNNRFFFGFMLFRQPEHLEFAIRNAAPHGETGDTAPPRTTIRKAVGEGGER